MAFFMRRSAFVIVLSHARSSASGGHGVAPERRGVRQKIALIQHQGEAPTPERVGARRTRLTEDELNSWFMYRAQPVLPAGVSEPQVTIVGEGKLAGQATVDLDAVAKRRSASGGAFDPWSLIGGQSAGQRERHPAHPRRQGAVRGAARGDVGRPGAGDGAAGGSDVLLAHAGAPAGRARSTTSFALPGEHPADRSGSGTGGRRSVAQARSVTAAVSCVRA